MIMVNENKIYNLNKNNLLSPSTTLELLSFMLLKCNNSNLEKSRNREEINEFQFLTKLLTNRVLLY